MWHQGDFELRDVHGRLLKSEPSGSSCPPHLRKLSLQVSANGDAAMHIGAGCGVGESVSKLQDLVPDEQARANIVSACTRGLREFMPAIVKHDGHMVIVGSGPSVADHVEEIRDEQAQGRPVMAIKGAHDWLRSRGITPDVWVSMDSQVSILKHLLMKSESTCYLVASKVPGEVFDHLRDQQVVLWHAWMGQGEEALFPEGSCMVGGGSTSGLRGITLAWLMGFRRVILYGFDSCLKDGAKRVDGSKPIDWTIPIQAGIHGTQRICDSSMASQANEFQLMTFAVMEDLKVKVVGDGLIADIMEERKRLGFIDW